MKHIKTSIEQFLNENSNQLLNNVDILKNEFNDYKEILNFFKHIEKEFYEKDNPVVGFGFCNETKSFFVPLFRDIANNLIKTDFNLNIEELAKFYRKSYYNNNILKFISYMNARPRKKYYYYQTSKRYRLWHDEKYSADEKMNYIRDYFSNHELSKRYDISIDAPVDFINVKLIEK